MISRIIADAPDTGICLLSCATMFVRDAGEERYIPHLSIPDWIEDGWPACQRCGVRWPARWRDCFSTRSVAALAVFLR